MKSVLFAASMLLAFQVQALEWEESEVVAGFFAQARVSGTFVLYDPAAGKMTGHDAERAQTRFVPASTFKIPNSLIGLAQGSARDVDEVLPYGGKPQLIKAWEQDMSLRDAFPASNVPVYQELARRTGLAAMQDQVSRLDYGNAHIGDKVDDFWLVGPLKISAVEQVRFLARLARLELDFDEAIQRSAHEISLVETGDGYTLHGKTGWANPGGKGVGWWVGWVRKGEVVYTFALNIDMNDVSDAPKRIEIGRASLKALGVL